MWPPTGVRADAGGVDRRNFLPGEWAVRVFAGLENGGY